MDGIVLDYDEAAGTGLIRGTDGARYRFARVEWRSSSTPRSGDGVDFVAENDAATQI